ncbi:MAG TPA: peptide-methionine (S)-S-oxide reductase MsrA [Longimicrobiales bacterium]|nr:peptide-methionine (S)-S-oxide reductase MsrA [Longimicrobiales bacterium]
MARRASGARPAPHRATALAPVLAGLLGLVLGPIFAGGPGLAAGTGLTSGAGSGPGRAVETGPAPGTSAAPDPGLDVGAPAPPDTAVFAGGCFWCMEPPYDVLDGVLATISGYAGGHVENPTYDQVTAGGTGHREAVMVIYDPARVGYGRLLEVFWHNVDPLDDGGQFCDRGFSYTTAIFAWSEEQAERARASKAEIDGRFEMEVVTPVVTDASFYPAEEYHQDYYRKNSIRYRFYRWNCGRDARLEELWGQKATH